MYKRILVPVDGSEISKRAGYNAILLAKQLNATVIVTYIADQKSSISYEEFQSHGQEYINEIRDYAS